jgi:hypothetical protein
LSHERKEVNTHFSKLFFFLLMAKIIEIFLFFSRLHDGL